MRRKTEASWEITFVDDNGDEKYKTTATTSNVKFVLNGEKAAGLKVKSCRQIIKPKR